MRRKDSSWAGLADRGLGGRRASLVALAALLGASPAAAGDSLVLGGVDVYGSSRITESDAQSRFGERIALLLKKKSLEDRYSLQRKMAARYAADAARIVRAIEEEARREWGLAWAGLTWIDDFSTKEPRVFLTFDLVEKGDAAHRMPFKEPPAASLQDPEGILEAWRKYDSLGSELSRGGKLSSDRPSCPAFLCTWGAQTPELAALESRFVLQVPIHGARLKKVLSEDRDPAKRRAAVYLLSYLTDGQQVSQAMQEALRDPDRSVRAAALEVFADMALHHQEVALPIEWLQAALDYPTVQDRQKALAVFLVVAGNPRYRTYLIDNVAEILLKLLRLKTPSNHNFAYSALTVLTGEKIDSRDYAAWQAWLDKNRTPRAPVGAPAAAPPGAPPGATP